uniref:Uncharacterized protein n=1 Tax=Haptolina brevifila TaxID=156173 RepID=A0A7S2JFX5_9EUKA
MPPFYQTERNDPNHPCSVCARSLLSRLHALNRAAMPLLPVGALPVGLTSRKALRRSSKRTSSKPELASSRPPLLTFSSSRPPLPTFSAPSAIPFSKRASA